MSKKWLIWGLFIWICISGFECHQMLTDAPFGKKAVLSPEEWDGWWCQELGFRESGCPCYPIYVSDPLNGEILYAYWEDDGIFALKVRSYGIDQDWWYAFPMYFCGTERCESAKDEELSGYIWWLVRKSKHIALIWAEHNRPEIREAIMDNRLPGTFGGNDKYDFLLLGSIMTDAEINSLLDGRYYESRLGDYPLIFIKTEDPPSECLFTD